MKIQFVSDYVCPYCYVAKLPLTEACRERDDVTIEWVPFELSRPPKPQVDTYNDPVRRAKYAETLVPLCNELGLNMKLPPNVVPRPYTTLAFEGFHYAAAHDCAEAYNDRVYEAYFVHEQDIGNVDVLCDIAAAVGLNATDFRRALNDGDYAETQRAAADYSRNQLNVRGVPTIFIDGEQAPGGIYTKQGFIDLLDSFAAKHMPAAEEAFPVCGEDGCHMPDAPACDENSCHMPDAPACDENSCGN